MTKEIISEIDSRFTSLNSIPVERATIRRHEWEALKREIEKLRSERDDLTESLDGIADDVLGGLSDEPTDASERSVPDTVVARLSNGDFSQLPRSSINIPMPPVKPPRTADEPADNPDKQG